MKDFKSASQHFLKALEMYQRDFTGGQIDEQVVGNIQFRLGWAYIRSRKNVGLGIDTLLEASKSLPDNVDLKVKLAQIVF